MPRRPVYPIYDRGIPSVAVVGTASGLALAAYPRRYAIFTNLSTGYIYLAVGTAAVVGQGFPIQPNGGFYEMNEDNLSHGAVYAAADNASSNLSILEGR